MPTAKGWTAGQTPVAAAGAPGQRLRRRPEASALDPRPAEWRRADRRGAEHAGGIKSIFDYAIVSAMKRAGAVGEGPNRIAPYPARCRWRRRRRNHRGVPRGPEPALRHGAAAATLFYLGNTDGGTAFPPTPGDTRITRTGAEAERPEPGRHWTQGLLASSGRAEALYRRGLAQQYRGPRDGGGGRPGRHPRLGPREPTGAASSPAACAILSAWRGADDGVLWTVVNERDGLGDETPPDYLTSVRDGGFYGWP